MALIEAWQADRWGNLTYRGSGRNFNPIMATAAKLTIAQAQHILPLRRHRPGCGDHPWHLRRPRDPKWTAARPGPEEEDAMPLRPHRHGRPAWRATSRKAGSSTSASACRRWLADHIPPEREVIFHSENGILGMGPAPAPDAVDPWLINAGKQPVTLRPGASLFHHADSFADDPRRASGSRACLAPSRWRRTATSPTGPPARTTAPPPSAARWISTAGAKRLWVLMEHTTKDGRPKLVETCSYPLTAAGVVSRVYTNLAVLDVVKGQRLRAGGSGPWRLDRGDPRQNGSTGGAAGVGPSAAPRLAGTGGGQVSRRHPPLAAA